MKYDNLCVVFALLLEKKKEGQKKRKLKVDDDKEQKSFFLRIHSRHRKKEQMNARWFKNIHCRTENFMVFEQHHG